MAHMTEVTEHPEINQECPSISAGKLVTWRLMGPTGPAFWVFKGGISPGSVQEYTGSCGTDFDNSEMTSPCLVHARWKTLRQNQNTTHSALELAL